MEGAPKPPLSNDLVDFISNLDYIRTQNSKIFQLLSSFLASNKDQFHVGANSS